MDQRYTTPVMEGGYDAAGGTDPSTQRLQEATTGLVDQARDAAVTQANMGMEAATDRLQHVAQAIRQTGQQLRGQDQAQIATFADKAAERVERASGFLAGKDVRDIAGEVERVARREPLLFVAGGLTLGLIAARFLKTTPPSSSGSSSRALQTTSTSAYAASPTGYGQSMGYGRAGGYAPMSTTGIADETPYVADELQLTDEAAGYDGPDANGAQGSSEIEQALGLGGRQSDG